MFTRNNSLIMTDMGSSPSKSKFKGSFSENTDINISPELIPIYHWDWMKVTQPVELFFHRQLFITAHRTIETTKMGECYGPQELKRRIFYSVHPFLPERFLPIRCNTVQDHNFCSLLFQSLELFPEIGKRHSTPGGPLLGLLECQPFSIKLAVKKEKKRQNLPVLSMRQTLQAGQIFQCPC